MSVLNKLTEGLVNRDLKKEGEAVVSKWDRTGLLEGLNGNGRSTMARLLENQAKELLREASSMAAGDVEGFAAVAFPIVRRVFGGLVANDLVSVQPMSLPSGLIFFLDFKYEDARHGIDAGDSVYGGGVVGRQLTGGVTDITEKGGGFYNLANAYSSPSGSFTFTEQSSNSGTNMDNVRELAAAAGAFIPDNDSTTTDNYPFNDEGTAVSSLSAAQKKSLRYDPDILGGTSTHEVHALVLNLTPTQAATVNFEMLGAARLVTSAVNQTAPPLGIASGSDNGLVRRLTERGYRDSNGALVLSASSGHNASNCISMYFVGTGGTLIPDGGSVFASLPLKDNFQNSDTLGAVVGGPTWGLEEPTPGTGKAGEATGKNTIAEIDIKVDSIAVTAITKKLKAKWSPELGQDLNAYHNLDAEVELTSVLSEHIALEIDREILNDLVKGATAGTQYWSRSPGLFVNRVTGAEIGASSAAPDFTGTVSEWYETLVETINDVSAQIHRKTLRGGATFLVTSPEVANILEFTSGFRANITHDDDKGTVGAVKSGNLSKKWDVYVDPYFPRNLVLVGRKGGSFLESGYVYAPYVPLQVTPTIFGTEDFVPRKGVMTRYAKKMVRPDMYGLVVVRGLLGEAGATS
jgi:hypothetical protein